MNSQELGAMYLTQSEGDEIRQKITKHAMANAGSEKWEGIMDAVEIFCNSRRDFYRKRHGLPEEKEELK